MPRLGMPAKGRGILRQGTATTGQVTTGDTVGRDLAARVPERPPLRRESGKCRRPWTILLVRPRDRRIFGSIRQLMPVPPAAGPATAMADPYDVVGRVDRAGQGVV